MIRKDNKYSIQIYYKLFVLLMLFMKANPFVNATPVTTAMMILAFVAGAVLVLWNIISKRIWFNNVYVFFIIGFSLVYSITILINIKTGLTDNIKDLAWFLILALEFFLVSATGDIDSSQKELKIIFKGYILLSGIMAFGSLVFVMLSIGGHADAGTWGVAAQRLFGLYRSPNYGALYSVISIICSHAVLKEVKKACKVILLINIIIQYLYVVYSGSYTGLVCLATAIILLMLLKVIVAEGWGKKVLAVFVSGILIFAMFSVKDMIKTATSSLQESLNIKYTYYISTTTSEEEITEEILTFEREDFVPGSEVGNGRFDIWKDAMTVFPHYPVFGTSIRGYEPRAMEIVPEGYRVGKGVTIHNDFLSLLICTGVVGTVCFMALIAYIFIRIIKLYILVLREKKKEIIHKTAYPLTICLTIAVTMLISDAIVFSNTIQSMMFWASLGYLICCADGYIKKDVKKMD